MTPKEINKLIEKVALPKIGKVKPFFTLDGKRIGKSGVENILAETLKRINAS